MGESSIPKLVADLKRAFPRQSLDPETVRVYARELADLPVELLEVTVRELIRTSEYFPSVRAIREAAAERLLALPGEDEALAQIEARIRWARDDEHDRPGGAPPLHPAVREALEHVGGFHAFRAADEPGVVRGQFLRLYRELRTRSIRDVQIGDVAALPAAPKRHELGR